ncbi:hypothetical protein GFY24_30270 [Nocardia sp. SYP-A9097]|uniref:hypothetical protein n=1 Tax=Nocardia sp. SYP-A9097 TaxID=2663237 RepID=UPI00129B2C32|nr:hypothetical protein [Nocardia sp. SYP-A9097]MRH91676.1 hypothetical protein [Nocardia sp. SYP-A9097]
MNPALPRTFNLLRRALAGAIVSALTVLVLLTAWTYAGGGWAAEQYDAVRTLHEWQYTISHLVPFPWE